MSKEEVKETAVEETPAEVTEAWESLETAVQDYNSLKLELDQTRERLQTVVQTFSKNNREMYEQLQLSIKKMMIAVKTIRDMMAPVAYHSTVYRTGLKGLKDIRETQITRASRLDAPASQEASDARADEEVKIIKEEADVTVQESGQSTGSPAE